MNLIASLFQHPASALVVVALTVLLVRLTPRLFRRETQEGRATAFSTWSEHIMCFLSGVLAGVLAMGIFLSYFFSR